jgi:hypothetical protein
MILCLIQPFDRKQMLKFYFQNTWLFDLQVINPDGVGPTGGRDITFCCHFLFRIVEYKSIKII